MTHRKTRTQDSRSIWKVFFRVSSDDSSGITYFLYAWLRRSYNYAGIYLLSHTQTQTELLTTGEIVLRHNIQPLADVNVLDESVSSYFIFLTEWPQTFNIYNLSNTTLGLVHEVGKLLAIKKLKGIRVLHSRRGMD